MVVRFLLSYSSDSIIIHDEILYRVYRPNKGENISPRLATMLHTACIIYLYPNGLHNHYLLFIISKVLAWALFNKSIHTHPTCFFVHIISRYIYHSLFKSSSAFRLHNGYRVLELMRQNLSPVKRTYGYCYHGYIQLRLCCLRVRRFNRRLITWNERG